MFLVVHSCLIRWCPSSLNTWHSPKEIWSTWSLSNALNDLTRTNRPLSKGLSHASSEISVNFALHCCRSVYLETFTNHDWSRAHWNSSHTVWRTGSNLNRKCLAMHTKSHSPEIADITLRTRHEFWNILVVSKALSASWRRFLSLPCFVNVGLF